MRNLQVAARDLVFALRGRDRGTVHYLDLESGDVIPIFAFNRARILEDVRAAPARYLRLAPQTGRRDYEIMSRFVETVDNDTLRGRLRDAIEGENVFSRFRAELEGHPAELGGWLHYRAEQTTAPLREKLREVGIELELSFD